MKMMTPNTTPIHIEVSVGRNDAVSSSSGTGRGKESKGYLEN